jgi:outer membrane protease
MGNVTFSIGAEIGQVGGTAYERVYAPHVRDFKVSELKWDIDSVAVAGVRGQLGFAGRFRVNLGYWTAVSEGDGEMVDRDWLLLNTDSDDQWTHESRHPDTDVDSGTILDANLDFKAFSRGSFSMSGIVGYRQNEWEWSSRGGSYTYSYDRNDDGYYTPDELRTYRGSFPEGQLVIAYRQEYTVPYLGLGLEGAWGPVQLQGRLRYSPWVSAEDHDYHALRKTTFEGDFSDGDWVGADISANWFFLPRWFATMGVEYQKFDEIRGDLTVEGEELPTGAVTFSDSGSVELETVLLLFGVGVQF